MSASFTAFLYLVSGVLFILALRGLSHPETSRQGNLFGMVGMALAILTTLFGSPPAGFFAWFFLVVAMAAGGGGRRRHRAQNPDDGDAAARRRLPLAGRPCRRARRRGGALCAAGLRHRHARRYPRAGAGRDVDRRRHRRDHLHRLHHRLPEARRAHVGEADHPADAACHQHRARGADRVLHLQPGRRRRAASPSGWSCSCRWRSASSSSCRSAAPTCRS